MGHDPIHPVDSCGTAPRRDAGTAPRPRAPRLHELVETCRDTLLDDWARFVAEPPGASALPGGQAPEQLSSFLDELARVLRLAPLAGVQASESRLPASGGQAEDAEPGGGTGAELDPLVAAKAYGSLHRRILEIAAEREVSVSSDEDMALVAHFNAAIQRAIAASLARHHADLHSTAHRLRNPLGSATMALTLLRSRMQFGDNARLAEMLERNLQRLAELIDDAVERGTQT